jgi:serine protease
LKAGAKPSLSVYDCRPFRSGNSERCAVAAPAAGVYHVLVRGYSAFSGVTLKASFQSKAGGGGSAPCTGCSKHSGNLSGKGALEYQPAEYLAGPGQQQIWLSGPQGTDFDLYLEKRSGSTWSVVARSTGLSSSEQISYQGSSGTYRLKVVSYAGSGAYELWRKLP